VNILKVNTLWAFNSNFVWNSEAYRLLMLLLNFIFVCEMKTIVQTIKVFRILKCSDLWTIIIFGLKFLVIAECVLWSCLVTVSIIPHKWTLC